jgi:hypothetical protein
MRNPTGTPREWQLFAAYCRWGCAKDAAMAVVPPVSPKTVHNAMANLYRRYGVHSDLELAQVAGWLDIPPDNLPRRGITVLSAGDITAATLSSDAG